MAWASMVCRSLRHRSCSDPFASTSVLFVCSASDCRPFSFAPGPGPRGRDRCRVTGPWPFIKNQNPHLLDVVRPSWSSRRRSHRECPERALFYHALRIPIGLRVAVPLPACSLVLSRGSVAIVASAMGALLLCRLPRPRRRSPGLLVRLADLAELSAGLGSIPASRSARPGTECRGSSSPECPRAEPATGPACETRPALPAASNEPPSRSKPLAAPRPAGSDGNAALPPPRSRLLQLAKPVAARTLVR